MKDRNSLHMWRFCELVHVKVLWTWREENFILHGGFWCTATQIRISSRQWKTYVFKLRRAVFVPCFKDEIEGKKPYIVSTSMKTFKRKLFFWFDLKQCPCSPGWLWTGFVAKDDLELLSPPTRASIPGVLCHASPIAALDLLFLVLKNVSILRMEP